MEHEEDNVDSLEPPKNVFGQFRDSRGYRDHNEHPTDAFDELDHLELEDDDFTKFVLPKHKVDW